MYLVPNFELNTDDNPETVADVKKRNIDLIEKIVWKFHQEFKSKNGFPLGKSTLEYQEEKRNSIRLFCEEYA
jgi:hypothetical protein